MTILNTIFSRLYLLCTISIFHCFQWTFLKLCRIFTYILNIYTWYYDSALQLYDCLLADLLFYVIFNTLNTFAIRLFLYLIGCLFVIGIVPTVWYFCLSFYGHNFQFRLCK